MGTQSLLEAILKDPDHPQVLRAIQVVLDRNELYGYGVEHQAAGPTRARVTTQVKAVSAIQVQSPSDDQFAPLRKLIEELRDLAAAEEPWTLPGRLKR